MNGRVPVLFDTLVGHRLRFLHRCRWDVVDERREIEVDDAEATFVRESQK